MNNINYNPNERFYDFSLNEKDFNLDQLYRFNYFNVYDEQLTYFISKLGYESKQLINKATIQQIKNVIYKKRLDNLNAIQNGIVCQNGKDDNKIKLEDYKDYYHLIFEYDINKLNQIKQILHKKFNIENVNLYQFDQKKLIYIFDKDSNFEAKINSPLFSNLNNRINNYNKENCYPSVASRSSTTHLFQRSKKELTIKQFFHCDDAGFIDLYYFNNVFDQNWYNLFSKNIKLFFDQITKQKTLYLKNAELKLYLIF